MKKLIIYTNKLLEDPRELMDKENMDIFVHLLCQIQIIYKDDAIDELRELKSNLKSFLSIKRQRLEFESSKMHEENKEKLSKFLLYDKQ